MPEPTPPGQCPACGYVMRSGRLASDGDYGVCFQCRQLLIAESGGWRLPSFDEAVEGEADIRVKVMKSAFHQPLPGSDEPA